MTTDPEDLIKQTADEVINRLMSGDKLGQFEQGIINVFAGLSESNQALLANVFSQAIFSASRGKQQIDQKKSYGGTYTRWLEDGSAVTVDEDGVTRDLTTHSLFDTTNVLPPMTATINSANPRQIDIRGGGGGTDCMFDYLVSTCWADEVTAGRGTEGRH